MKKLWKWLFGTQERKDVIHSVTCGERDENGFAYTYVNGKKTNVRLLLWDKEDVERLQKIGDKIHNKNRSEIL